MLGDFLLGPAALRDFMTLREFTDIFPKGHRTNPAVQDVYRELQRLREKDMDLVRRAIADEVSRSKRLRREYARERRQLDDATVAGLDPMALLTEEEVHGHPSSSHSGANLSSSTSSPTRPARNPTRSHPSTPVLNKHANVSNHRLPTWKKRVRPHSQTFRKS
jgi:hypothetical protein